MTFDTWMSHVLQSSGPAQTQQGPVGGEDSSVARRAQGHDEVNADTHMYIHKQQKKRNICTFLLFQQMVFQRDQSHSFLMSSQCCH